MFAVFRSGEKNRFSSSAPIKNIYRKNSSMVGRVFLFRSGYETVQEICAEINRRNMLVNSKRARREKSRTRPRGSTYVKPKDLSSGLEGVREAPRRDSQNPRILHFRSI